MSSNDKDVVVDPDEIAELPEVAEGEEDSTDYKALAARNAGIAKRYKTKFEKSHLAQKVDKAVEKVIEKQKEGFDNADKAYLRSAGFKPNEFELVQKYVDAGKSFDEILDEETVVGKLVQAELKDTRDAKASKDALPTGTKRTTSPAWDTVEYHLAKETPLTQIEDRELRFKVLEAKKKTKVDNNIFSDRPFGGA